MSLQTRLFTFFIGIVVLPLLVAMLIGRGLIVGELERRTFNELNPAQRAAIAVYDERVRSASDRVALISGEERFQRLLEAKDYAGLKQYMLGKLAEPTNQLDYIVVGDANDHLLSDALTRSEFLAGLKPPSGEELLASDLPTNRRLLFSRAIQPIKSPDHPDQVAWTVVGGYYLDNAFVKSLSEKTAVDATLLIKGKAVSSTLEGAVSEKGPIRVNLTRAEKVGFFKSSVAGESVFALASPIARDVPVAEAALLMSRPQAEIVKLTSRIRTFGFVLLLFALLAAGVLGFYLAQLISRPLKELAEGANAIAAGNYEQHIEVRSRDEVGQLARSFNEMTRRLAIHIQELRESREDLKRAFTRFGETLRSTHDLDSMLENTLEASMDTLRAQRGVIMLMSGRDALTASVARGLDDPDFDLELGKGISGYVAETGNPVRLPNGTDEHAVDPREPNFSTALAVPLFSQERVIGVLTVFDKEDGRDFSEADMGTILSLADHAGVAIENVLLHREAQKLAIMDGLTSIWNYRYFQMQFEQEIDRARRYKRPFSLIEFDIDNFKTFNDTYGHQLGDSVLIEIASRVKNVIRDIDMFARYGGEEFVLILPETDSEGGMRTAEKIRQEIASTPFKGERSDLAVDVTLSVGVACFPDHGSDKTTLLRNADLAMYAAKASGKNRVVLHRPDEAA
ncbi:MAG: diguanylate cyclase [Actinomycetota bacterium]|nr:diguanylate cyclase [Actinomycetota bacterium]